MTLSPFIAIGATAEIHAWKDGQVLKLFNQGISRSTIEYEANNTRLVHDTGLPVPAVGEIIEIDGRFGLEYERVEGVTMLQALMKSPWKFPVFPTTGKHPGRDAHAPRAWVACTARAAGAQD